MATLSTDAPISPLRQRMLHDMLMRGLARTPLVFLASVARSSRERIQEWWAIRQMAGHSDSFLKDVGVPRCGIATAVRRGRERS